MAYDVSDLAILLKDAIGDRPVREAAERCGVPQQRLYDILYGRSRMPEPDTLRAIERGLGIPYDKLALAAYGVNGSDHDDEPVPA